MPEGRLKSLLTDAHPLGFLFARSATEERVVYLIAQVVIQVEKRAGMARVEHGGELGSDGQAIDQQPPKILDQQPV